MKYTADEHLKSEMSIVPDEHAAGTVNGAAVDCLGFRNMLVTLLVGAMGTSGTVDVKLQDSEDGSTDWQDIDTGNGFGDDAEFTQKVEGTDDSLEFVGSINLEGCRRYVRAVATVATAASDFAVLFTLGLPREAPVTQVNTSEFQVA